ncbi:hypothetical protein AVEN_50303-1, partial [Araneus ventricosus]
MPSEMNENDSPFPKQEGASYYIAKKTKKFRSDDVRNFYSDVLMNTDVVDLSEFEKNIFGNYACVFVFMLLV